jgi:hypothetical protein
MRKNKFEDQNEKKINSKSIIKYEKVNNAQCLKSLLTRHGSSLHRQYTFLFHVKNDV